MRKILIIYLRLSKEDKRNFDESNSISNQRQLIWGYIRKHRLDQELTVKEFVDDGYSGKNLDRPGIQEVLSVVRERKAAIIIVKDFSRMGRDHIVMGDFIDKIFPFMGVRFIAVNNGYDSDNYRDRTPNLDVPFQNLIYDYYSEENSVKVKNAFAGKRERGEYFGRLPPYGYLLEGGLRGSLTRDWIAGGISKWIFHKRYYARLEKSEIRDILNEKGIPTPGVYLKAKGYNLSRVGTVWTSQMVSNILHNAVHIGVMENGKRNVMETGSKTAFYVPKEKWTVKWNRHKPNVSLEVFLGVQEMDHIDTGYLFSERGSVLGNRSVDLHNSKKKTIKSGNYIVPADLKESPVKGVVYCGGCKHNMLRKWRKSKGIYYFCRYVNQLGILSCSHGLIYEKEIEEIVMEAINNQIRQAADLKEFYSKKAELCKREQLKKRQTEKKMLDRIDSLKMQSMELYEQYQEGKISKEQFVFTKDQLNAQKRQLEEQAMNGNQTEEAEQENKFLKIFGDREPITKLTREMTDLMVERINIFNHKKIQVVFKFADEYHKAVCELREFEEERYG